VNVWLYGCTVGKRVGPGKIARIEVNSMDHVNIIISEVQ